MMPVRYESSDVDPWLMGVLIRSGDGMLATSIEPLLVPLNPS